MKKLFSALLLCVSMFMITKANVRLPKFFSDNMVLQRNKPINIWGWASPKEKISIQFNHQTKTIKVDNTGKWLIKLDAETAGGPYRLIVSGRNKIIINNVLVGEVWIASGQSNMEMPIAGWGKIFNYEEEIKNADYPLIRQFDVPNTTSATLQDDVSGGDWKICNPANAGEFSAAAYFFARQLYNELKIPIGIINSTWGGTQVESWISKQGFTQSDEFKNIAEKFSKSDIEHFIKEKSEKLDRLTGVVDKSEIPNWKKLDFDDSQWKQLKAPGVWEQQGLGLENLDGIVWYRKTIVIADEDAGKPAVLQLAKIDDNDETFVNGANVGSTMDWYMERQYAIPAGVLKAGKNIIAIKITDNGGGGGIYGDSSKLNLTTASNKIISLTGEWKYKIEEAIKPSSTLGPNDFPTILFNAMINPLIPYTFQGVIWYQGESNEQRAFQYRKAFPLMITDWRNHWNAGNFPFLFVQLSTYGSADANSNSGSKWGELRESQTKTLSLPNTGMIVTTDIGNPTDIHPKNKQEVGKRLAALALHDVYNKQGEYMSPMYKSIKIEGNKAILSFSHAENGWFVKDKYGYLKGFEIAGADKKFYPAKAIFDGDKIVVLQDGIVEKPVAVRYNWADDASEGNVYNMEKFPLAPFRTDEWKGITDDVKYKID